MLLRMGKASFVCLCLWFQLSCVLPHASYSKLADTPAPPLIAQNQTIVHTPAPNAARLNETMGIMPPPNDDHSVDPDNALDARNETDALNATRVVYVAPPVNNEAPPVNDEAPPENDEDRSWLLQLLTACQMEHNTCFFSAWRFFTTQALHSFCIFVVILAVKCTRVYIKRKNTVTMSLG